MPLWPCKGHISCTSVVWLKQTKHLHSNAAPQDCYEVNLKLVTVAGTEYTMQANLSHYEDVAELEDYILCFLPTVSDLEVFGCELELLDLRASSNLCQRHSARVLLQRPQLQIVVRPCMVERHSIWHFQADGKEGYPKAVRCPGQPARGNCRQSILRCTFDPARRSGNWHPTYGNCGLAELPATADCQASIFGRSLAEGSFMGCYWGGPPWRHRFC